MIALSVRGLCLADEALHAESPKVRFDHGVVHRTPRLTVPNPVIEADLEPARLSDGAASPPYDPVYRPGRWLMARIRLSSIAPAADTATVRGVATRSDETITAESSTMST